LPGSGSRCLVCSHPARVAIEKAIGKAASLQFVADRYGMTNDDLQFHKDSHMLRNAPALLEDNQKNAATIIHNKMDPVVLFEEHDECILEAKRLIEYCLGERDHNGWVREPDTRGWALGIREWRGCLDQKNRMLGLYDQVDPRLQRAFAARIIQVVSMALESFPEAKQRVLLAIDEVEKGDG
jgi:hypothetical protein